MSSPNSVPIYMLNNGVTIPAVAHGAWAPHSNEARSKAKEWLLTALKAGYRHIDTAQGYYTEGVVGEVIKESKIPRKEIFITSKLSSSNHHRVAESFEESLKALSVDYIDLFLIHWPQAMPNDNEQRKNPDGTWKIREDITFHQAWAELEKLMEAGKVKAIGVSNFSIKTLKELATTAKITPAVNQVELHPYLVQENLREYCDKKGIVISAYTPSGYDTVRKDPLIVQLAEKYKVTPNQITLAWHLARHIIIIPKSLREEHQKENINLPILDAEDIVKISKLDRNQRICNAADEHGQVYGWSLERLGW
ncbi:Protein GCY [Termitomyces sp. T112]|nr:Protein GCY [Termitomyces sp. T112]